MTHSDTTELGGFGFAIRHFELNGTNLVVRRCWSRESHLDPQRPPKIVTSIYGKGVSEKDSVCVIGSKDKVNEFDLTIKTDAEAKVVWDEIKEIDLVLDPECENSPALRLKRKIREDLDKAPPTAVLFVTADDWENGTKGGWSVECMLPKDVFEQLEGDLIIRSVQEVIIRIEWTAGLVYDQHAPPGIPTTWGLFKTSEDASPEPLYGHVTSFGWPVSQSMPSDVQN